VALEQTILEGLKQHLIDPELFKEFCGKTKQASGPRSMPNWRALTGVSVKLSTPSRMECRPDL
jgi:hypothetical protein